MSAGFFERPEISVVFPVVALMKEMGADMLIVHFKSFCANMDGPPSPVLTQCLHYDEDDSMTESELELDIKRVFSPMYYERKRKRDEMENGD